MSTTVSYTELLDRPVIAVSDAQEVGSVKNLVLDRAASRVERIQVAGRKRSPELVDWERIRSVGADAVMINASDAVHESRADEDDDLYVRGDIEVIGAAVTTSAGFDDGEVTDLHIDAGTGAILAAMTSNERVDADRIRSLGTFGLIID